MLYDRVMRSIQNRHKRTKHMNLFINARFQRKLRKFAENPLPGSQVSGLGSPTSTYELDPRSQVSGPGSQVSGPGTHLSNSPRVSSLGSYQQCRVSGPTMHVKEQNQNRNKTKSCHIQIKHTFYFSI